MAGVTVVCPACDAGNRVPAERLPADAAKAVCGKCKARLFPGEPVSLADASRFRRHIEGSGVPVLVDFWAEWCGPCRMMAPEFEKAAAVLEPRVRLAKLDTDAAPDAAAPYGIRGIPTLILFSEGREIARQSGAMQAAGIVRFVEANLGKAAA
jgi:thioredoxin 2